MSTAITWQSHATRSRVYTKNWRVRVKWAPFRYFRGPFFQEWGSKKGGPQKENEPLLPRCRHFGTFWATEKAWVRITAESRMFVW